MSINMPHEGGLQSLGVLFGSVAKDASFYISLWVTAPPAGLDYDDADMVAGSPTDSAAWLTANGAHMSTAFAGEYEAGTLSGETATNAALQAQIKLVGGVPQVEFPQYAITFKASFDENIYGYAVVGATSGKVYFREKFTTPFAAASKRLVFIPTLKLGNTTYPLT